MARPSKANTPDDAQASVGAPAKLVLKKNFGYIANGRDSVFYEAGAEFDPDADAQIIAELVKRGAIIE